MKKLVPLLVLLALVATGLWAQFYTTLPRDERRTLAEAYYLVGQQYEQKGENLKARDFKDMAFNIDPGLDPANIQLRDLPSAAALILEGKARLAAVPRTRAEATQELLKSKFLRLVSAFLSKDTASMLDLMEGSVYFGDLGVEMTQGQIETQLNSFFSSTDLTGLAPSSVYDLNSLTVSPVTGPWGETYAIQIRAKMDFSRQVAFWTQQQKYLMHQSRGRWLLFSVGQKLPPANWNPKPAPRTTRAEAVGPEAGPQPEIKAALLACLDAFLDKDVDTAARYFADEVQIIRLNTSLTRQEISETFMGYFEGADFTGVSGSDVVDADSIFISPSDRYPAQSPGEEYLLTVKTRLDLSDTIPFWTRFQDYYFAREMGTWRVFAIF
ncbi:MAG: hypothetical protein JSV89_21485 [Spirochaetaceae bacterium]|nr:MAG: hypothetical protein JSV89_21485 [Spirochaetaceae bacterium]